jgi:hypothetical protein
VPLIRISPWPVPHRSAFCVSGDVDCLSVRDFLARLVD